MVRVCEVFGCPVRQGQKLRLFYFPKNEKQRSAWLSWVKINRPEWSLKTSSRICELHFAPNCYEKRQDDSKILKMTAVPSLQSKLLENIENARYLQSLPRRFKTSQTRICLSDVPNSLKVKKPIVLHDHPYCLTFVSS